MADPEAEPNSDAAPESDDLMARGLRRLEDGDSTGWRGLLREHRGEADQLAARARRLQRHGMFSGMLLTARLGAYQIGPRLGGGGMGIVYRARRDGAASDVAIKVVRPELLDSEHGGVRFCREVEAAMALRHPGIVAILDHDFDAASPWFAMELVDGPSLAELIAVARRQGPAVAAAPWVGDDRGGALSPWCRFVLATMVQVLDALAFAHARGIAHRDVKPSNILVAGNGRAVLIDFGLAHTEAATTITRSNDVLGSLPYLPPEVLAGSPSTSSATDVYSAGVALYHALALQLPFAAPNSEGLRASIRRGSPTPLRQIDPTLPPALDAVWQCAMAPEPKRRYRDAAAFAADLRAVLDGRPPRARLPSLALRTWRLAGRYPLRAAAAALAVLVFVVVPSLLLWVQRTELWRTLRSSDLHEIARLRQEEPRLWPATPQRLAGLDGIDDWLQRAGEVLQRAAEHRRALATLRQRGHQLALAVAFERSPRVRELQRAIDDDDANLRQAAEHPAGWEDWMAEIEEHRAPLVRQRDEVERYVFAAAADQHAHRTLAELDLALDELAVLDRRVRARRDLALELQRRSLDDAAELWQQTLAAIADRQRHPVYRGLRIEPQFGLLPLGVDPASGLFEFVHLPSGEPPVRGADGRLVLAPESGLVFVLLPGGSVRIGADREPSSPHFDPAAAVGEGPSVVVRLDPFFVAKFEVTQAQWVRQRGHNNCTWKPGLVPMSGAMAITPMHPIDNIMLAEIRRIAAQWGVQIPTGAQWEYAARAGAGGAHCGADLAAGSRMAHLRNVTTERRQQTLPPMTASELMPASPWPMHRPVGGLLPNAFGLHDVFGNAAEWCRDAAPEGPLVLRDGDGSSGIHDLGQVRGGSFSIDWQHARTSAVSKPLPDSTSAGLRPVRSIEGAVSQGGG